MARLAIATPGAAVTLLTITSSTRNPDRPERRQVDPVAVTASTHNPILAAIYQRLTGKGKPAKVAIVAVMRKMLCVLNRMVADPQFSLA